MLSSVLRSARAIHVNIEIMRAFVRLRQMIATHAELARKLEALDRGAPRRESHVQRRYPTPRSPGEPKLERTD